MTKPPAHSLRAFLLGAAILISFTGAAMAEEDSLDMKKGKWSALTQHIGTYEYDTVLNDKGVKKELDKLLKGQTLDLKQQFGVTAPIGFQNDCLILKGNQENQADTNRAYMEACVGEGTINLVLYNNGKINVYSQFGDYKYLSEGVRGWIAMQNDKTFILEKPENVQFVVQAK